MNYKSDYDRLLSHIKNITWKNKVVVVAPSRVPDGMYLSMVTTLSGLRLKFGYCHSVNEFHTLASILLGPLHRNFTTP